MCRGFRLIHNGVGRGSVVHYVQDKHEVNGDGEIENDSVPD